MITLPEKVRALSAAAEVFIYARKGDKMRAEEILDVIKSESVKSRILKAIWGETDVGHE